MLHFTEPDIWDLVYPGSHIVICSYVQRWAPETFKPTPGFSDLFPNYLLVPGNGGGGGESRVRALRWLPREVRGRVRSEGPGERLTGWEHDCGYKLQQQVAGWHRAGLEGWSRRLELGI